MRTFWRLVASAVLAVATASAGYAQPAPERWIPTWAAPDVARVDQPAQTLGPAALAFSWTNDVPEAVREAAPSQQLEVAGGSRLHFADQTLRQIARVSTGGSRVRVVLTNTFGTAPLRIGAAQVALRDKGPSIVAGTSRVLTFGELAQLAIPPGALMVSDPVNMTLSDFSVVVVDLYLPDDTAAATAALTRHAALRVRKGA